MKNKSALILLTLLSINPLASLAQSGGGHGGYVYDCENMPLIMLDYYEATKQEPLRFHPSESDLYSKGSALTQIRWTDTASIYGPTSLDQFKEKDLLNNFLQFIYALRTWNKNYIGFLTHGQPSTIQFQALYASIKQNLTTVGEVDTWIEEDFKPDEDSNHIIELVKGCKVYQGIQRRGNKIYILPGLKGRLDPFQKKLAQLHEAVFKTGVEKYHHETSSLTRLLEREFFWNAGCKVEAKAVIQTSSTNCALAAIMFMDNDQEYRADPSGKSIAQFHPGNNGLDYFPTPLSVLDFFGSYSQVKSPGADLYFDQLTGATTTPKKCPNRIDFSGTFSGSRADVRLIDSETNTPETISRTMSFVANTYYGGRWAFSKMNEEPQSTSIRETDYALFTAEGRKSGIYFEKNPDHYFNYSLVLNETNGSTSINYQMDHNTGDPTRKFSVNADGGLVYEFWQVVGDPFQYDDGYFQRCYYSKNSNLLSVPPQVVIAEKTAPAIISPPAVVESSPQEKNTAENLIPFKERPVTETHNLTSQYGAEKMKITLQDGAVNDGDVVGVIIDGTRHLPRLALEGAHTVIYEGAVKPIEILVYGIDEGRITPITVDCTVEWSAAGKKKVSQNLRLRLSKQENSMIRFDHFRE